MKVTVRSPVSAAGEGGIGCQIKFTAVGEAGVPSA